MLPIKITVALYFVVTLGLGLPSTAGAFGPPSLVVTDASPAQESLLDGSHLVDLTLEGISASSITWTVTVTTSTGWNALAHESSVRVPSSLVQDAAGSLSVKIAPRDKACPPVGLVLGLQFDDPSGEHYSVAEHLYFSLSSAGLVQISNTQYLLLFDVIDSGLSATRGCQSFSKAPPTRDVDPSSDSKAQDGSDPALLSTSRTFSGQVIYWDSRGNRSDATGTRLPKCNTSNTTCTPGSNNCCRRPVPHALVVIWRSSPTPGNPCKTYTDINGNFSCNGTSEPNGSATYKATVRSEHSDDNNAYTGGRVEVVVAGSTQNISSSNVTTSSLSVSFPLIKANTEGDTTSTTGNAFTAFVAADEVFRHLDTEGETRHHATYYDRTIVNVGASSNSTDCDDATINIQSAYSRAIEFVHLLGFIYMGQVIGCSGNVPAYPTYLSGGYDTYTAEGNALRIGIPSLLVTLSRYDPGIASTTSIFSSLYPCVGIGSNNANHASYERNNWHALWEIIDTDTGNTSGSGSDLLDLTIPDLMDGLVALKNHSGSAGQNYSNAEQILTEVPYSVCFSANDCSGGDACVGNMCYTGDPHGENIWDLAYNMCTDQGCPGLALLAYGSTLTSSPCLGTPDNSYPYTGGFRTD